MANYESLKARQRKEREHYPENLSIRVHRALSWLKQAEQTDDTDSQFIFLWIAFNAAYAQEFAQKRQFTEKNLYQGFLEKLIHLDKEARLTHLVWQEFSGPIRVILDNDYILQAYWEYQAGYITEESWQAARKSAKARAHKALANSDTATVLAAVFSRLYTLRNQLLHGGATHGSQANRAQLKDCVSMMQKIVPLIIEIMMDGNTATWGDPVYPLV
ncbi:HEPN domain-containing protein [Salinivibrio sp. SS2]|uniref:HEPN domain-containing protein n=1 Tax=Salinivibrio sp. SS2 TaxID=1892894 RepID=UPI00084BFBD5|nr:HEPN domain-containing protein [Salinivibrio sp. DV]ODQ00176.1 hypothetical protein BGK46_08110 [Salinivibrio sp. DV]